MLNLSIVEIVTRIIPESLLLILVPYIISGKKLKSKEYLKSAIILGTCVFVIRLFPISYGIHTLLNLIILVIISNVINGIDIMDTIKAAIVTTMLLLLSEGINLCFLKIIYKENIFEMFNKPIIRSIMGIPSLIIFGVFLYILYKIKEGKK